VRAEQLLGTDITRIFHCHVKSRSRGATGPDLPTFSAGEVWLGEACKPKLGLIDGHGHLRDDKQRFGPDKGEIHQPLRHEKRGLFCPRFGAQIIGDALDSIEDGATYAPVWDSDT